MWGKRRITRGRVALVSLLLQRDIARGRSLLVVIGLLLISGCALVQPTPTPFIDAERFPPPPRNAITFWGHSTCYIDVDGVGIVTDPVLSKGYSPWHRREVPAPPRSSYANARFILISHAHRDHLNPTTLSWFPKSTTIICPGPSADKISDLGMNVLVMKPGDSCVYPGGSIIAVNALHPGGRNSLKVRNDGGAIGYIVRTPGSTLYYSGDTEYFDGLTTIGHTYDPDVALLNVNGHLPATDALRAFLVLGVSRAIPIHSSAYTGPAANKNRRFRKEFAEMLGQMCVPLEIGESYAFAE
ncbi:MAG: hypothetical protein GF341_08790 [candidate division Zixibacteria bacterium]|nr:hypothetical protein [candidate division Zixibacteria bacterium]